MVLASRPKSEAQLTDLFKTSPFAMVKVSAQSGNVFTNIDCNGWGEASSAPHVRKVPMSKDGFKKPLLASITAR